MPLTPARRTKNEDGLSSCMSQKYRVELLIEPIGQRPIISGGLDAIGHTLKRDRPVFLPELQNLLVYIQQADDNYRPYRLWPWAYRQLSVPSFPLD